ncbi:MAG: hypothetical protein KGL73_02425 [Burkholderiales bacterium]|jgi:hypothetical protein|nr:hypothetical protein [Burkholderiales bacterium]
MQSARKTRLKLKQHKPRNPLVAPALQRKAGSHRAARKTQRQDQQRALQRELARSGG